MDKKLKTCASCDKEYFSARKNTARCSDCIRDNAIIKYLKKTIEVTKICGSCDNKYITTRVNGKRCKICINKAISIKKSGKKNRKCLMCETVMVLKSKSGKKYCGKCMSSRRPQNKNKSFYSTDKFISSDISKKILYNPLTKKYIINNKNIFDKCDIKSIDLNRNNLFENDVKNNLTFTNKCDNIKKLLKDTDVEIYMDFYLIDKYGYPKDILRELD